MAWLNNDSEAGERFDLRSERKVGPYLNVPRAFIDFVHGFECQLISLDGEVLLVVCSIHNFEIQSTEAVAWVFNDNSL